MNPSNSGPRYNHQTDETTNMVLADGPIRNYEEELVVQMVTVDKAKERYEKAKAKVDWIKEQVAKSDVELQQLLHDWTAQLQEIEKNVDTTLKYAQDKATAKIAEMEEH